MGSSAPRATTSAARNARSGTTRSGVELVVVVADLHCGSTYGLLPPGFVTHEGNEVACNGLQRWLWMCWTDWLAWCRSVCGGRPFVLVVNGDATEGVHHGTREVISVEPVDHLAAAAETLKPLSGQAVGTFVVEGTECHTSNMEHALAKQLKAVPDHATKTPAWRKLRLKVKGVPCVFQHHIGTTSRGWLEASALSIHLRNEQVLAMSAGHEPPRVLCAAHRHVYGEWRGVGGLCVVSPPWQGVTRYGRKVVPSAVANVGGYILDFADAVDGLPRVHSRCYSPPQSAGVEL